MIHHKNFRIGLLSDLHIPPFPKLLKGVDPRARFEKAFKLLLSKKPDALVFLGDLAAQNGEKESYLWIKEKIQFFKGEIFFVAGNHDRVKKMKKIFHLEPLIQNHTLYYSTRLHCYELLFLDSSSNKISIEQIEWLKERCADPSEKVKKILFTHYPVIKGISPYMDQKFPLENQSDFFSVLKTLPIEHIFCGHSHVAKELYLHGKTIHSVPSTWVQFDGDSTEVLITDASQIGYSILELGSNKLEVHSFLQEIV